MGAIVRQQYTDPNTASQEVREMHIDIEIVRPDDSERSSSELYLKVEPAGHHPTPPLFDRVYVDPNELITIAIDGKRTSKPPSCWRARLTQKALVGDSVLNFSESGMADLRVMPGHPLVLLDTLKTNNPVYVNATNVHERSVEINTVLERPFFKGAFVQNLANRWHGDNGCLGAKSQLKRPQAVPFYLHALSGGIEVTISYPMTPGVLKAYDIYVRNHEFTKISPHWIPDVADVDVNAESASVRTFNGGECAGGGTLQSAKKYYVALVAKDRLGFDDANESAPFVDSITLP